MPSSSEYQKTLSGLSKRRTSKTKATALSYERDKSNFSGSVSQKSKPVILKVIRCSGAAKRPANYILGSKQSKEDDLVHKVAKIYGKDGSEVPVKEVMEMVKGWDERNANDRRRTGTHLVFSIKEPGTPETIEKLSNAVVSVQQKHFTEEGYESFFTIHKDTEHLHAHLLLHNRNMEDDLKIEMNRQKMQDLKMSYGQALRENGLDYFPKSLAHKDLTSERAEKQRGKGERSNFLNAVKQKYGPDVVPYAKSLLFKKNHHKKDNNLDILRISLFNNGTNSSSISQKTAEKTVRFNAMIYTDRLRNLALQKKLSSEFPEDKTIVSEWVNLQHARWRKAMKKAHSKDDESVKEASSIEDRISSVGLRVFQGEPAKVVAMMRDEIKEYRAGKVRVKKVTHEF